MNRKEAAEILPIIKAFCEGKQIQVLFDEWKDVNEIGLREFLENPELYRIKPELKYRPFKDAEECWQEMQKHHPFGWVKDINGSKFVIENVDSRGFVEVYDEGTCNFNDVFEFCTFADGTPYGIKEEKQLWHGQLLIKMVQRIFII